MVKGNTKGEWKVNHLSKSGFIFIESENSDHIVAEIHCPAWDESYPLDDAEANADLIVTAVKACQSINPGNPMAVAEKIEHMYEALKAIISKRNESHETEAAYIPPEIEQVYKLLSDMEVKQ